MNSVHDPARDAKGWRTPLVIPTADFRPDGNDPESSYFHSTGNIMDTMTFFESSGADTNHVWLLDIEPECPDIQCPKYEYLMVARLCSAEHRLYAALIFYSN